MEEEKIFYKKCPTKRCKTISGFSLPISEIKKNKKYLCQECGKECYLNLWKISNQNDMNNQIVIRKYIRLCNIDRNTPDDEIKSEIAKISSYKKDSTVIKGYLKGVKEELK